LPPEQEKSEAGTDGFAGSGAHLSAVLAVGGQPVGHQLVQVEQLGWLCLATVPEGNPASCSSATDGRGS